jgi:hypothetical protein
MTQTARTSAEGRRGGGGATSPRPRRRGVARSARASSRRTLKRVKQRKRRLLVGTAARGGRPATPSNCGKFLKLSVTKHAPKGARGRGNDLGYGKSTPDATMDDPQPSPKSPRPPEAAGDTGAVQRLDGGGFREECVLHTLAGLKI